MKIIWTLRIYKFNPANNEEYIYSTLSNARKHAKQFSEYDWRIYKNDTVHTLHNRRKTTEA